MRTGLVLIVAVLLLVSPAAMTSQSGTQTKAPPQGIPPSQDPGTVRVVVDRVNVLFTVADRKGKFATNLKREDFRVFEDNVPQTVTNFTKESDLPLTVALLVDTSGSIRDKLRFEQEAAIEFFYSTIRKGKDQAIVISFDSGVDLVQDFTDNPETLADGVRKIRAGGGTSLYDAMFLAVNQKLMGKTGRKVVIVISDGDDNSSRISLTETMEAMHKNEVSVYAISTNQTANFGGKEQDKGDKTLKRVTEETGGKAFFPFKLSDLAVSFQDISDELRSQYSLAYQSTNVNADGAFRKIRIDVADRRLKVRARSGYYGSRAGVSQNQ